ncbi:MAG: Uncharacterised protein [Flavobacteriaceae bacterium]|jgi:hypothetical protein|nr:MAG: Uncharacterised protein [Flavobacteriaceae bacterium]|tara:strand:+ start:2324 stop:3103 length:780 start_codon:yes stop_codon:yes gene_type:complete
MSVDQINQSIQLLREDLLNHSLYSKIKNINDLQKFVETHIFAVWDFMSLLKSLQSQLTCTNTPWLPNKNSKTAYLINEIVLAEETDINQVGERKSHYELYLEAIKSFGADTNDIDLFLNKLKNEDIFSAINSLNVPKEVKYFLEFTFKIIEEGKPHKVAAAFTFGRENLIPSMFTAILKNFQKNFPDQDISKLIYYFERHIELDEDEHGPMALEMVTELAGNDPEKWQEIEEVSVEALKKRIGLWNSIESIIINKKVLV